jgi:hypothetical protein
MANKASSGIKSRMPEGKVSIKYVKRAKMWCKTWFEYDHERGTAKQVQEWSTEKPNESK